MVFNTLYGEKFNDFGTKTRFKCHKPIQRKAKTLDDELCTNWNLVDSLGVRWADTEGYTNFYDNNTGDEWDPSVLWLRNYVTVNNRLLDGEKGFILKNGTFERFEPVGITWNDSYCRRISEAGPSGCFVERDLSAIPDFNYQENNCTGKDLI